MKDRTKEQLIEEIELLRREVNELRQEKAERKRAEETLSGLIERLRLMYESVTDGITVTDSNGVITNLNKRAAEIHGFSSMDELLGKHSWEFIARRDRQKAAVQTSQVLQDGKSRAVEYTLLRADGSEFPGEISASVLKDASGNPIGFVGITRDITERKRAEEALRKSEEKYRKQFDEVMDAIFVADAETGILIDCNRAACELVGWEKAELVGKPQRDLHPPEKTEGEFSRTFKQHLKEKEGQILETQVITKKGEIKDVAIKANFFELRGRKVLQGSFRDITERKKAAEEVETQRARFKSIFDHSLEGIVTLDINNNIMNANLGFENIFGYKVEEIKGERLDDLIVPKRFYYTEARELDKMALDGILGYENETIRKRKDGTEINVSLSAGPIQIGEEIRGRFVIFSDITERKQAEEKLKSSEERLKILFEFAPDAYYLSDLKSNFVDGNKAAEEITGYKREELIGKNFLKLKLLPPKQVPKATALLAKNILGQPTGPDEFTLNRKDGSQVSVEIRTFPVRIKEQTLVLGIARDITARKRSEDERARLGHDLLERVKELRCFYSLDIAVEESSSIDEFLNRVVSLIPLAMQYPELARSGITFRSHKYHSKDFTESKHNISADIKVADKVVGSLGVYYSEERPFLKEEVDLVTGLAERIGKVVEGIEAKEMLQENEKRFRALIENSSDIIQVVDSKGVIRYVSPSVQRILGYRPEELIGRPSVDIVHPDDLPIVARGFKEALEKLEVPQVTVCRCKHKDGTWRLIEGIGVNQLNNPAVNGFIANMHDITERKRAEEQLERSFIDLAETVSRAMGSRDPYTSGHQRRVAELACLVGEKMGWDEDRLKGLHVGGLLHDIGKISTPESILTKPGRLSDEEWNLVCAHAKQGYEILKDTKFPWPVAEMALHHHERMDGSGYPDGISGDKLSLENRILGVCDVVEAMSSFRPYRPARSLPEVLKELSSGRGTKYDADIVDVMLELIESGEFEFGWEARIPAVTEAPML